MEERKRPALGGGDDLPPSKRQAVSGGEDLPSSKRQAVNGRAKESPEMKEMREESWIHNFQKGAIYREMQECKRKADKFESRLKALHERSVHHDDHLRFIDAWWKQLLEEIELLAESTVPDNHNPSGEDSPYLTRVHFEDLHDFTEHLEENRKVIKLKAQSLLTRLAANSKDVGHDAVRLQSTIAELLVAQKDFMIKLDRLNADKQALSEELDTATLRYFKAEKKLDRARSYQVQMLEQQALSHPSHPKAADSSHAGNDAAGNSSDAIAKYEEAAAVAAKHREQLEAALAEIKILQEENSALRTSSRKEPLTDEEYIRTDVFKHFKAQNEDLIRRVNHLEATNRQLREDTEKLHAERVEFQTQLENDSSSITHELAADVHVRDQDLTRIRAVRDELLAEVTQRRAGQEQERRAIEQMKELVAAKEDRITALEAEVQRYKPVEQPSEQAVGDDDTDAEAVGSLSAEELRAKYHELEQKYSLMNAEIESMDKAYRKISSLAQKKVLDMAETEEKMAVLIAEKGKADQKYFAARRENDAKIQELRARRLQSAASSEIISQLKDAETQSRALLTNLEKQLADLRRSNTTVLADNRRLETSSGETAWRSEALRTQVAELTSLVRSRDESAAQARERTAMQEAEVDRLKVRVDHVQKDRDSWKTKALNNSSSEEEDMLRTITTCTICRDNFKDTALKTCGHLFCRQCLQDRIDHRRRKCPSCSRAFDKMDLMPVHH